MKEWQSLAFLPQILDTGRPILCLRSRGKGNQFVQIVGKGPRKVVRLEDEGIWTFAGVFGTKCCATS